jgi:hypothetical protein
MLGGHVILTLSFGKGEDRDGVRVGESVMAWMNASLMGARRAEEAKRCPRW